MIITSRQEYELAELRIEQLTSGDFVDVRDLTELRDLLLAATGWEAKIRIPAATQLGCHPRQIAKGQAMTIITNEEFEAAIARAHELMDGNNRDVDQAELIEIGEAVATWYRRHDDAAFIGMKLSPDQPAE